jgi:hypothetical protein
MLMIYIYIYEVYMVSRSVSVDVDSAYDDPLRLLRSTRGLWVGKGMGIWE